MFDILKAVREIAVAKAGVTPSRKPAKFWPELIRPRFEIERTQRVTDAVRNHSEQAVDPTLIDYYIYELNAAQLQYQSLLCKLKSQKD